jgi:predicted enzyme related to lactoylglutathione lyase
MDVGEGKAKSKYDMLSYAGPDGTTKHRAGVLAAKPASLGGHWLPWVAVDDIDATVGKVKALKGKVVTKPHDVPGVGRAALVTDPTGAPLGLLKSLSPEEMKAAMDKAAADKAATTPKPKEDKKAPDKAPTP